MRKTQVIGALLIALLLVLGACGPAPAEFEVIALDIEPLEVVAGETVNVTAVVKNIGGSEGTYAAVLTVDGVIVEAKEVAITPASSKVVAFSLVKDKAGTYEIGIGELSSSLTVTEPAEFEVVSLDIEPLEVVAGETVTITAVVENIGGSEGTYTAVLTVDGVTVETKEVAITPGASKTVTFSLVKDAAGTYEIGVGGLSSSLVVKEELVIKEFELKYDDGSPEGIYSALPDYGYIIDFLPPATPFSIKKVRIFGMLAGSGWQGKDFTIAIWNKEYQLLHDAAYPVTEFDPEKPKWVEIDIPDVEVTNTFYIHVYTGTGPFEGIHIGTDDSVVNEHSDVTVQQPDGTFIISTHWPWPRSVWWGDKSKVNWMIRVVGTTLVAPD